jgi:hypothetical protein
MGFLCGLAYGLAFRRALSGPGSGRFWKQVLVVKMAVLVLVLALLARLGAGPLLAFPAGFFLYLVDFIIVLRRSKAA